MKLYRKIDIYVDGKYICSTNRAKTLKEAAKRATASGIYQCLGGARTIPSGIVRAYFA